MIKAIRLLFVSACFLLSGFCCTSAQYLQAPSGLMVNFLRWPAKSVITDRRPSFSWIINDKRRMAVQGAYQVLVASSRKRLLNNKGDVWNSGKLLSGQSVCVIYGGKPLKSNTAYWWKVRTWDGMGDSSAFSAGQLFYTGDFVEKRSWPAESHWVRLPYSNTKVLEDRGTISYYDITPQKIIRNKSGSYFIDFGKSAFATLQFTMSGKKQGDTVWVYLGDRKNDNNTVDRNPGGTIGYVRSFVITREGTQKYTVQLPRHGQYSPHRQYLPDDMPEVVPFRYAEIEDKHSTLHIKNIRQYALLYPFDKHASFFVSNSKVLNEVYELCKHTMEVVTFNGIFTDGNRERMPYEADSYIAQLSDYALDREYAIGRYTWEYLIYHASWPAEWQLHVVMMAYADYMQTGDTRPLARFYNELQAKTLIALSGENGLISTRTGLVTSKFLDSIHYNGSVSGFQDIVDWPPGTPDTDSRVLPYGSPFPGGERDHFVFCDYNAVVNAFYYHNLILMGKIAHALGKREDEIMYQQKAEEVKKSFNDLFFEERYGVYADGNCTRHASLHANLFALAFGLVPDKYKPGIVHYLQGKGMACSPYGAQYLLEALYDNGAAKYALDLMTSKSDRSWFNMLRMGSTTTTEAWDFKYKENIGWEHAWGTAPANIIPGKMFGIVPLKPAFREVAIKPQMAYLSHAAIRVPTIRGAISCDWERNGKGYIFKVSIPANTFGQISLPGTDLDNFSEGGVPILKAYKITPEGVQNGYYVFKIGGGDYTFHYTFD